MDADRSHARGRAGGLPGPIRQSSGGDAGGPVRVRTRGHRNRAPVRDAVPQSRQGGGRGLARDHGDGGTGRLLVATRDRAGVDAPDRVRAADRMGVRRAQSRHGARRRQRQGRLGIQIQSVPERCAGASDRLGFAGGRP